MNDLSELELRPTGFEDFVSIWVDGKLLAERMIESQTRLGRDFVFTDESIGWNHVNGPRRSAFDDDLRGTVSRDSRLLTVCGCNVCGCGDVDVDVRSDGKIVEFLEFDTNRGPMDLPPIRFDKDQFFEQVDAMHRRYPRVFPR